MKKITAILIQRSGDYHISVVDNSGVWDSGKTLKQAIDAFKRTAKTFGFELGTLKIDIDTITEITW